MFFSVSKISTIESSTGSTKQAESWPSGAPAFIRVGVLGMNSRLAHQAEERLFQGS